MPVHIDELNTEVVAEAGPAPTAAAAAPAEPADEARRLRQALAALLHAQQRLAAEGHDD